MDKVKRNYSFDFLKILAATGIVFHHFQAITGARYDNFINFSGAWFNWGYLVELFFILSGYFMYHHITTIQEGGVTLFEWWKKRAVRLLPMCAVTVVAFEIILFIGNTVLQTKLWGMDVSVWGMITAAFGVQEGWVFRNPVINNSVWYISALMLCYIVFYIVTALSAKLKCNSMYFYVAIILFGIAGGVYGVDFPFWNWQICRGYYAFFFGLLLSAYINKYGIKVREIVVSFITLALFGALFILSPEYADDHTNYMMTFFVYPALIILFETKPIQKIFCHKVWGTISAISFEVYLWHLPCMLLMYFIMGLLSWKPEFSLIFMFVFTLIMWAIATLMYFLLERPLTKLFTKKKPEKEKVADESVS